MQNVPGAADAGGAAQARQGNDTLPSHFQLADPEFNEALGKIQEAIQVSQESLVAICRRT